MVRRSSLVVRGVEGVVGTFPVVRAWQVAGYCSPETLAAECAVRRGAGAEVRYGGCSLVVVRRGDDATTIRALIVEGMGRVEDEG